MGEAKVKKPITLYLEQLTYEFSQLCQRSGDGSIYGIPSGKQCRKGSPISFNPNIQPKAQVIFDKAKAIGLSDSDIGKVWDEVKGSGRPAKEVLRDFATKANELAKSRDSKKSEAELEVEPSTGFLIPKGSGQYDVEKDIPNLRSASRQLGWGEMGAVALKDGPPPGVIKEGHIGQYEAEALGRLKGTGIVPELHGVVFTNKIPPRTEDPGFDGHVKNAYGALAMSKMEGEPLEKKVLSKMTAQERDEVQSNLIKARKVIHQAGIAHNDTHVQNIYVKPDGSVGLIDFGLSQVGYRFALIEAMGSDWQFENLHQFPTKFRRDSPDFKRLQDNKTRAIDFMKKEFGLDWDSNTPIRIKESDLKNTPLGNLSDLQIKQVLDILYEGF